jgi:hypothetical protein
MPVTAFTLVCKMQEMKNVQESVTLHCAVREWDKKMFIQVISNLSVSH